MEDLSELSIALNEITSNKEEMLDTLSFIELNLINNNNLVYKRKIVGNIKKVIKYANRSKYLRNYKLFVDGNEIKDIESYLFNVDTYILKIFVNVKS